MLGPYAAVKEILRRRPVDEVVIALPREDAAAAREDPRRPRRRAGDGAPDPGPPARDDAAQLGRGARRPAAHQPAREPDGRLGGGAEARLRRRRGVAAAARARRRSSRSRALAVWAISRAPAPLPAGAHGPRRARLPHAEVPHHAARRREARRGRSGPRRTTRAARALGALPAPHQRRRAAAALERAARRHEPGRPAARAPGLHRALPPRDPGLHAAPQGARRAHGLGAGPRLARRHVAPRAHRARHLLHPELVARRSTCASC